MNAKILIVILAFIAMSARASERHMQGDVFVSEARPELRLKVDPRFEYIGGTQFALNEVANVDRHHWVEAEDGRVTALIILQFESLRDGVEGGYQFEIPVGDALAGSNYRFSPSRIELGGHDFVHNTWAYDNGQGIRENPGSEPAHTARLLDKQGYSLDDELIMSRFVTEVGPEGRGELIVFYIEPLSNHGKSLEDFPDGGPANPDYDRLSDLVQERSLAAITWLP